VFERATLDYEFARSPELLLVKDGQRTPLDVGALNGYDGEVRRQRRKCYDCGHRATEYAVTQQFFDELIAAREIVTKLAAHYWEITE